MTDPIRRLVMQHADMGKIEEQARAEGMRTMYEDGLVKALERHDDDRRSAARDAGKLMALYRYKAVTLRRRSRRRAVRRRVERRSRREDPGRGQYPAGSSRTRAAQAGGSGLGGLFKRTAMSATQVLQFTQQLRRCSAPACRSTAHCRSLLELPEGEKARRVIERVRDHGARRRAVVRGLEAEPASSPRLYVNMVRAGEIGGSLDATLARLANYLERAKALRESVVNAMIYPAILIVMVFARAVRAADFRRAAVRADVQGHERRAAADHQDRAVRRRRRCAIGGG